MASIPSEEEDSDWGLPGKTTDTDDSEENNISGSSSQSAGKSAGSTGSGSRKSLQSGTNVSGNKSLSFNLNLSSKESLHRPKSKSKERVDWNKLPYGIILEIYSYLDEKDRTKMARTCKTFNAAFHSPILWRKKYVLFAGIRSLETASKSRVFLSKFGTHIRHLEVECGHPTLHSARPMAQAVEMFLTHLSKVRGTKILSLKIDYMDFYHGWRFFEMSRARLVGALCKFIRKQRHLQFIDISGAQIDFRDGGRVLKALAACHAKNTLQTLQMKDFFELRYMAPHNDSFLAALRKFTTLKHLYLNFIYLNQTVLDILGKKLGTTLESLRLVIDSSEPQGRVLSHYDWTNFRERSPNCKVIFHFLGMMSQIEYTSALCRGAQVVEVDILSWEGYPNDLEPDTERMSEVVMHIANNFYKDLVRFRISIDHTSEDPLDNSLIYLLQKCTKLREFTINAAMTLATVDTICKLAAQRMPKILDHLELRVRGLSPENTSQLALITQAYMNQINTRQLELRSD